MIRKSIFILLFCCATFPTFSQFIGGIKGGLNINQIIVTNGHGIFESQDFKTRYAYHLGSFIQNTFSDHLAWKVEMLFSNKGYNLEKNGIKSEVSLHYLNWPVLFVYKPNDKLGFEAGLEPGLLISGESLYNGFDIAMDIGVGYELTRKWITGIRYSHGFPFEFNIDPSSPDQALPEYRIAVLQVYLGFNIMHLATD
jgi:hypothetical protein